MAETSFIIDNGRRLNLKDAAARKAIEDLSKKIEGGGGGGGGSGENGATFTPSVDEEGNLSWTNDKGLENPKTVNIKGPPGEGGGADIPIQDTAPETGNWWLDTSAEVDAAGNVVTRLNRNLLDNWYFGNPVDQRGGCIAPQGIHGYAEPECVTDWGPLGKTVTAHPYSGTAYKVTDGGICYVKAEDVVRGYTGVGYTIDRWRSFSAPLSVALNSDCLHMSWTGSGIYGQIPEDISKFVGKTITISALVKNVDVGTTNNMALRCRINGSWTDRPYHHIVKDGLASVTIPCPDEITSFQFEIGSDSGSVDVIAVKLELGSTQTLAHQENGVWVLNDIPDYGEELRKCQRYFVNLNPGHGGYITIGSGYVVNGTTAEIIVPIPVTMRAYPTVVTGGFSISAASVPLYASFVEAYNCGSASVNLHCTIANGRAGEPCFAYGDSTQYVWLSADL